MSGHPALKAVAPGPRNPHRAPRPLLAQLRAIVTQMRDELAQRPVRAGGDARAQVCQVVYGVCAASRQNFPFALPQDQDRSLARDASDFTINKLVSHHVPQHHNTLMGKTPDKRKQGRANSAGEFHERHDDKEVGVPSGRPNSWRIKSTAPSRFSENKSGMRNHSPRWYSYSPRP